MVIGRDEELAQKILLLCQASYSRCKPAITKAALNYITWQDRILSQNLWTIAADRNGKFLSALPCDITALREIFARIVQARHHRRELDVYEVVNIVVFEGSLNLRNLRLIECHFLKGFPAAHNLLLHEPAKVIRMILFQLRLFHFFLVVAGFQLGRLKLDLADEIL